MILAIDPGRSTGWCVFDELGRLMRAGLARKPQELPTAFRYTVLVIEKPHGGPGKSSRLDLATLARRMQSCIDHVAADRVEEVSPARWKGQTKKSIMTARIRDRWADAADRAVFEYMCLAPSLAHNAWDAYGLGRYYFATRGVREIPA